MGCRFSITAILPRSDGLGVLLVEWEITYHAHPERFFDETNAALRCANCKEKLCSHKKQLRRLHAKWHIRSIKDKRERQQ